MYEAPDDKPTEGLQKQVLVRRYGVLPPLDWGQDCLDHLVLMNRFWNVLVEIDRAHRAEYRAIVGEADDVIELNRQLEELDAQALELEARRKKARIEHRARMGPHTRSLDDAIKAVRAKQRDLFPLARAARKKSREIAKPRLAELEDKRRAAVKQAYQESGLYWANYNAVMASYETARTRAMREGTDLKFHRFDGSGRFTCRIQWGKTPEQLMSTAGSNEVLLRLVSVEEFGQITGRGHPGQTQAAGSRRGRRQYGILSMTVYSGRDENGKYFRRTLDCPIILHRPLPEKGLAKLVVVKRHRSGPGFVWTSNLTFTWQDSATPASTSPWKCGIHLGWRQVKDGLRVATIFDGEGPAKHLVLPQVLLDKLAYVDTLHSQIGQLTNEAWRWVLKELGGRQDLPWQLAEQIDRLSQTKVPHSATFAALVWAWSDLETPYLPESLAEGLRRRKEIKRLELEAHNLRAKVLRRRLDLYRNEAKALAEKYGQIALERMDLRRLAAREGADGVPTEMVALARRNRGWAAVGEFREWIIQQSKKTGTTITVCSGPQSKIHGACGHTVKPGTGSIWTCEACGESFDSADNAAANLLREIRG